MEVRLARDRREVDQALELRERVFTGEQGIRSDADRDGRDGKAIHVVASVDGSLLGTCRLVVAGDVAMLGRLAVERSDRRTGVGRAVLDEAERAAAEAGATRVVLHAQVPVQGFYERSGYSPYGEEFVEEGIRHVAMEKRVA